MRWETLLVVGLGAVALGGCGSIDTLAPPVSPALLAAAPGTSAVILEQGRRYFTGACTGCHSAEPVARHSMGEWREIVDDMAGRAKLDAAAESALLAYIGAARAGAPTRDPGSR